MTAAQIKKLVKAKLRSQDIDADKFDELIDLQIPLAVQSLWNHYPWENKRRTTTESISSGGYWFDAPDDCDTITRIAFGGSTEERDLDLVSAAEFDSFYPNLSQASTGVPMLAKVVFDDARGKTEIYFGPPAGQGYTFVVEYDRMAPDVAKVPNSLLASLVKLVLEEVYPTGSEQQVAAQRASSREILAATNPDQKARPDRRDMGASIRYGRHIFNMGDDYQDD